ncbi:MAG: DUF4136 domain-containing protein [Cyclobacteriaceae bacterium]
MKNLIILTVATLIFSCNSYEHVVDSDYSYEGNFNRYKSFDFARNSSFSGSEMEKEVLEKYLKSTLQSWGYDHSSKKPGLLVFYSVFYEDFNLRGFNQPQFQGWIKANFSDKEVVFKKDTLPDGSIHDAYVANGNFRNESYDEVTYRLTEGTILVTFIDRKRHKAVWHGYASGIFGSDEKKNSRIMRSAVIRIMDEYKLLAFGSS